MIMKVMKKVLAVALMAAMAVSMTACGGAKGGSSTWKIGGIGPLTGGAALYGNAALNGAQIAVDEINEAGGINGYKIEFKAEDDQHDAEKSVNAYNSLKDWGMQALCGTVTTTPCLAVAELSAEDNIFEVTPSASNPDVVSHDNCFQVCFTDPNQGSASAKYIGEKKLASKVAVIYNSSDSYSQGVEETFVKEAANQSFEIVVETAFTDDSKTDFSTQLQQCQDAGAELVEVSFDYIDLCLPTYYLINYVEFFSATRKYDGRDYGSRIEEVCGDEVLRRIKIGSHIAEAEFSGKYYKQALKARSVIRNEITKMLENVDLIVGPTVPKLPHEIGAELEPMEMYAYDVLTVIANLAGIPAASIKAGEVEGIPVGLQIQAKPLDDEKIIKAMSVFENTQ